MTTDEALAEIDEDCDLDFDKAKSLGLDP